MGYVTNISATTDGRGGIISADHDLRQVQKSIRMAKRDLRAPADPPPATRWPAAFRPI